MTAAARATMLPSSLTLVGAGKMGGAMLAGWLRAGLDPSRTTVIDPSPSPETRTTCAQHGIALNPPSPEPADVLVIAIKPQGLVDAAPGLAHAVGPGTLVLSILAGKTIADITARLPAAAAVVRAMPNLPASIGRGVTGAVAGVGVTPRQRAHADALLACVGLVEWLDEEALIDALTAVSGSGPAYVFHLVEALADAGCAAGLPRGMADRLARATVTGAGALLDGDPRDAARLRQDVTSPGGTTAEALAVLMREDGLAKLMRDAVAAATRRAGELSG